MQLMVRSTATLVFVFLLTSPVQVAAFDYLEHVWFTDYACSTARQELAVTLSGEGEPLEERQSLAARYLALSLVCPEQWERPYCAGGDKQATAFINLLRKPPSQGGGYSVTLGDYAALPDHVSRFGPVRRLPRARKSGLVARTLDWIVKSPRSARGAIEDVAEDACEMGGRGDLDTARADVDAMLARWKQAGRPPTVPPELLSDLAREAAPLGPSDPPMKYSFDNPHYLDLVLRNHTHFGEEAYAAWLGFHSAAIQIASRRCRDVITIDEDEAEDLADGTPGFDAIDFDELSEGDIALRTCRLLAHHVDRRLRVWAAGADAALRDPVTNELRWLDEEEFSGRRDVLLDRVVAALLALVFEGSGIHFLQDGLAAGHMRTIRSREALVEVRHDHDRDNADGIVALLRTRQGTFPFVAFGDGRLLARPFDPHVRCVPERADTPEAVTDCLIQHQRGVITAASAASLMDFALGGTMTTDGANDGAEACTAGTAAEQFVCQALPVRAPTVAGQAVSSSPEVSTFYHGTLPVPPPDFSYESFDVRLGIDAASLAPQVGVRLSMSSELDQPAHWLTSYRLGFGSSFGRGRHSQLFTDFSYAFHYRFYARVMLDMIPYAFAGVRGLDGSGASFFAGAGPALGITVLPEGWTKMPLAASITYRIPFNVYSSDHGFLGEPIVDGHRVLLGIGLAFLH